MARVIFVGKTGAGKTTLIQNLKREEIVYKKTQATEYYGNLIDTPGEYLENPRYYNALITLSFDADIIALVQDMTSEESYFPPGFGDMFNIKVVGILTKSDMRMSETGEANHQRARRYLVDAGASEIYEVSACTNQGMDALLEGLQKK